ncbi:MAG: hypothetical protein J7497_07430 [Chitinophagaceae bacterium]|nr:hypothetical protein [Chitinophagaceae bacterium]
MGLKGALGKQVVFRQRNGKTFLSAYPDMSNRKLSAKQKKVGETMAKASKYANEIMQNPETLKDAQFRLDLPQKRLYNALVKEYFKQHYNPNE